MRKGRRCGSGGGGDGGVEAVREGEASAPTPIRFLYSQDERLAPPLVQLVGEIPQTHHHQIKVESELLNVFVSLRRFWDRLAARQQRMGGRNTGGGGRRGCVVSHAWP